MEMALSFLDLPQSLRVRIYTLAGFLRQCPIGFTCEGARRKLYKSPAWYYSFPEENCDYYYRLKQGYRWQPDELRLECFCSPLPWQLLHVSRTVHDEVERILYSNNRFKLTVKQDTLSLDNRFDVLRLEDEFLTPYMP